jgi:hypothetical protein
MRNSSSLPHPLRAITGRCAPTSSRRSPCGPRSGRGRVEALLAGGEGGTVGEGWPCLVVPAQAASLSPASSSPPRGPPRRLRPRQPPRDLVVLAPTRMGTSRDRARRRGWGRPVHRGGATSSPRQRVLPLGSAPAARAGGGGWRRPERRLVPLLRPRLVPLLRQSEERRRAARRRWPRSRRELLPCSRAD